MMFCNRQLRLSICCWILCVLLTNARSEETQPGAPRGAVAGQVLDVDGQPESVAVSVFLCDRDTGYLISAKDHQLLNRGNLSLDLNDFVHATTVNGEFEFREIPAGDYRLVAQSWDGVAGIPGKKAPPENYPLRLHGTTTVTVTAGESAAATLKAAGSATVHVQTDPDEGNAFLFLTLKKPVGDYILGTTAWQRFGTQVLGATHLKAGDVIIRGLPDDSEIHFCYLNYDNNPGVGGGACHTGQDRQAVIKVYASWSNGQFNPPARLLPLVEELEASGTSLSAALGQSGERGGPDRAKLMQLMDEDGLKKIVVGDAGEWTVLDIIAANSYRMLRRSHAARRE